VQVNAYLGSAYVQAYFGSFLKDQYGGFGDENRWDALQVHLTAPSLHTINGQRYDAELFIAHKKGSDINLLKEGLVLSIPVKIGSKMSAMFEGMGFTDADWPLGFDAKNVWQADMMHLDLQHDVAASLQGKSMLYQGSVPVPPCSETFTWVVMETPMEATENQIAHLRSMLTIYAQKPGSSLGGAAKRADTPFPRLQTGASGNQECREIWINDLSQIGVDHQNETCQVAKKIGTWKLSARCWDYVDPCWSKYWSPVEITTSQAVEPSDESKKVDTMDVLRWKPVQGVMVKESNYSLDIEVPVNSHGTPGNFGYISLNGHIYFAKKISVKVISQHTIDHRRFAGELTIQHLMYGDDFGKTKPGFEGSLNYHTVAVSIPLKLGLNKNPFLQDLSLSTLPDLSDGMPHFVDQSIDLLGDLQGSLSGSWYWYSSNSTHPEENCKQFGSNSTFSVRWMVFTEPLSIDLEQLNLLTTAPSVSGVDSSQLTRPVPEGKLYKENLPADAVEINETDCGNLEIGKWKYGDKNPPWEYGNVRCWASVYPICRDGKKQSPIDIRVDSAITPAKEDVFLHRVAWHPIRNLRIANTGHNLQVNNQELGYTTIMGDDGFPQYYEVAQFHIHMPSEHLVGGKQYAAEIHVVHKRQRSVEDLDDTDLLVTGFFFDVDQNEENPFLKQIFIRNVTINQDDNLDHKDGSHVINDPIDLMQVFGPVMDGNFFRYDGSLTTPPCSEAVKWFVFEKALPMSIEQWLGFKEFYPNPNNNRPVQELFGRSVYKNSFQEGTLKQFDFYLGRDSGRDRVPKDVSMILLPVFGSIVLAVVVMIATFSRPDLEPEMSAGGLREALTAPDSSKVGKSV
jgi:carbonic anhydrase